MTLNPTHALCPVQPAATRTNRPRVIRRTHNEIKISTETATNCNDDSLRGWSSPSTCAYRPLGKPDLALRKHSSIRVAETTRGSILIKKMGSTSSNESNESHVQPATSSNAKLISPPDMKHLRVPRAAHSTAANALHKAICQSSARRKRVEHGGKFIDDFQISTFPPPFVKLPEGDAWKSCAGTIMYPLPTADMRKDFEQVYQLLQKEKPHNAKCVAMYPSKSGQTEIGPSNTEVPAMDMPYTTRRPQVPVTERMPTITQHKHKASFERIKGLPVLKQRSPRSLLARSATKAKQLLLKRKHRKNAATQSIVVPCVVLKNSERRGGHPLYQLQSAVQKVENVRQYSAAQLERFLHKLEYDRLECYERKTSTLRDYGDTTRAMHHMRQAAENMRQSDVETCYEKSSWYNGLLSIISAGGKDITKEELFVAHYIKLVLDRGHIFCKQMLMALIKCFSNEEIGAIQLQEVFRFLRNEAIPEDDTLSLKQWDAFFAINKLPEPIEVLEEKKRLEKMERNSALRLRNAIKKNMHALNNTK